MHLTHIVLPLFLWWSNQWNDFFPASRVMFSMLMESSYEVLQTCMNLYLENAPCCTERHNGVHMHLFMPYNYQQLILTSDLLISLGIFGMVEGIWESLGGELTWFDPTGNSCFMSRFIAAGSLVIGIADGIIDNEMLRWTIKSALLISAAIGNTKHGLSFDASPFPDWWNRLVGYCLVTFRWKMLAGMFSPRQD